MLALAASASLATRAPCQSPPPFEHEFVVASAGDVDGDGTSEILVATADFDLWDESSSRWTQPGCGAAWICSFAKGKVLSQATGAAAGGRLGSSVAAIEEHGPGRAATCLVGEPGFAEGRGRILVVAAETLGPLRVIEGDTEGGEFGAQVLAPDDFLRGHRVLLVAGTGAPSKAGRGGDSIEVVAFQSGERLARHRFTDGERMGRSALSWVPDLNGDDCPDVAIGLPTARNSQGAAVGRVEVRSGRTLELLHSIVGAQADSEFGCSLTPIGARTAGGGWQLLVGAPSAPQAASIVGDVLRCDVRSGLCLPMLDASREGIDPRVNIFDTRVGSRAGESVTTVGDVDRDGIDDYAVGGPTGNARMLSECGWVRVVSGGDNETLGVSSWNCSKKSEVPLTYCGFGGRMSLVRVLRQGSPCSLLAVSSSRPSMARGVVLFDVARVARGGAMVEAAVWEATRESTSLDVRSPADK